MKKYSYVGISFIVLIFGIWVVSEYMSRNSSQELVYVKGNNGEKRKVPDFKMINQNEDTITNESYAGKVYVVEFFFASCPTICPIMNENLVKVQNEFFGNPNFGIASFTINPENDTPKVLKEYAKKHNITHANWHLLTGDREKIYKLARSGFSLYARENTDAAGGFEHSGYFALIDKEGYIRSRRDKQGNPIIFYDGSTPYNSKKTNRGKKQIDWLIQDIEKLL
jgi:protein SCO1/2